MNYIKICNIISEFFKTFWEVIAPLRRQIHPCGWRNKKKKLMLVRLQKVDLISLSIPIVPF